MQTKFRFDPNSQEIKAYRNELAHQFVREGTIVAFPTCLPGMTTPIPHDESRITALDINCSMPGLFPIARAPKRFVAERPA